VLKRRVPRVIATGFLLTVAVSGLSACRTSPTVAAYVGNDQVTVAELQSAADARRADPDIATYADANEAQFTRRVLTLLVQEDVYAAAAEHYGVEVRDGEVKDRIAQLLGDQDPDTVYGQLATQGVGREDVFENVRQQLVREKIAVAQGKAQGLTEEGLRAAYEKTRQTKATVQLGYIDVPDQATADTVLARVAADPATYPAVAAQYPGQYTLPQLEPRTPDQVPPPLADQVTAAKPNTGFTSTVEGVTGVLVGFVGNITYPTFEQLRPQLEQQAGEAAAKEGAALVNAVRDDLDITINPRFGEFKDGELAPGGSDVVTVLEDDAAKAGQAAPAN
jgi:SurA-like protein